MSDVFISIDTEFSAGGYFNGNGQPITSQMVYCRIGGVSHGLGFMLDTFAAHGITATFFVEAAHAALLGHDAMKPAIEEIAGAGHDIQLHVHPMWISERKPVQDSFEQLTLPENIQALEVGLEAFEKWSLPKPLAFRAGNLQIGKDTYTALEKVGIPVSSSIGLAVHSPSAAELHLANGVHRIGGVTEVPVLTYHDVSLGGRKHRKNLTVTGCGARETAAVLKSASGVLEDIVILTHPFEFVKRRGSSFDAIVRNRVNQRRLDRLCHFIAAHPNLRAQTFAGKAALWQAIGASPAVELQAPLPHVVGRILENQLNDRLTWY